MQSKITFLILLLLPIIGWSQEDTPIAKPLKIEATNKLDDKGKKNEGTALRIPDFIKDKPKINIEDSLTGRKPVKMIDERELIQAGTGLKVNPKFMNLEDKRSKEHFGDMSLGEISTSTELIGVMIRDHSLIDGDRIRIWLNGEVIHPNILMIGNYKALNIELDRGLNKIEFEAISAGTFPPNSAQIDVYNQAEKLIFTNYWGLSEGARASFNVVRIIE